MPEQIETTASLVLEGGGSRGVFTAGVLDFLMEKNVKFPYVVGVSAGSCNALDYVSAQPGRTRDCMVVEDKKNNYIATRAALKKHELFDMDMLFDKYPNELFPFDFDTFFASDTECEMVVTNCQNGEAEYLSEKRDRQRLVILEGHLPASLLQVLWSRSMGSLIWMEELQIPFRWFMPWRRATAKMW